ncbi:MAG: IS630 family transposase [Planctomycetaceae bacterium]|nr:IS630 family transposase [Planctomycetaceae bacterium]MBV8608216.1 IS630 family transposase [Singulisphaera sp.]MBV8678313.1 IS630 family transposase [Planctomycetaceae bacterium]
MSVRARVVQTWQRLTKRERQIIRIKSIRSGDGVCRFRCKIIMGLVQGKTPSQLAAGGLCAGSQVYRVAHLFLDDGLRGMADRREDNGEPKVHARYASELLTIVAGSPQEHGYLRPTWTQELLILVLAERTGVTISVATMSRLLKRLKVRLGRPKPIVECPWEKARRDRKLRRIRRLVRDAGPDEVVLYVDEVDIHLNPKIGLDWMLRGQQKETLTPGQNEKRYLAGALNPRTGKLTWVEGPRKTSLLFLQLLYRLVMRTYRSARVIHVILDNYGIHDSLQVRLALATVKGRVKLHFLPPYCPNHNRIERIWEDLHANVTRNHRCRTMEQLMEQVRLYLKTRNRRGRHAYPRVKAV